MHYELIKQNQNRKLWKYVKESSENILKYHFDIFKFEPENYFDHYSTKGFHEIPDIDISGFKNLKMMIFKSLLLKNKLLN